MYDKSKGLLTSWRNAETERSQAMWRDETIKVPVPAVWLLDTLRLKVPMVRPKSDEITFGGQHHESVNLWLVMCFATMFFVFFLALLWMFS